MAHILHLSDLHLGATPETSSLNDAKSPVIPAKQRQLAESWLVTTLESMAAAIRAGSFKLDSIVISGDIADKNNADGYTRLPEVLAPLVPGLVPTSRVVIVPGNHDVRKGTDPSTEARWKNFLGLRDHGYVTALLEGIDLSNSGERIGSSADPILVGLDDSFALVAVNSSNHSQTQMPTEPTLNPHLDELRDLRSTSAAVSNLWSAWELRGAVDVAWVGEAQLASASRALASATRDIHKPLRIAVLHHQLLPVGPVAEIKAFESMLNAGAILDWLADNGIDVLMHGHKHYERVLPIAHTSARLANDHPSHRTIVISAPSAIPSLPVTQPIARIVTTQANNPRAAGITVHDLTALGPGAKFSLHELQHASFVFDEEIQHGVIQGQTSEEVHQKLLALSTRTSRWPNPLVCRIADGPSANQIPTSYPDLQGIDDPQSWFSQTVLRWQADRRGRAADFNHGERIEAFGAHGMAFNQFQHAVAALNKRHNTSRAVMILVDPPTDMAPDSNDFPAFTLVQFNIRDGCLDVVAYFRKQEMPHWWPINVGELAHLQRRVIDALHDDVSAGSITTITTQPVVGSRVPKVATPLLDRLLDEPLGTLQLLLPLFGGHLEPATARELWEVAFVDWAPTIDGRPADGDPVPLAGLKDLHDRLRDLDEYHGTPDAHRTLSVEIHGLYTKCMTFRNLAAPTVVNRNIWINDVRSARVNILRVVDELLESQPLGQK